jgi:hypothetical protein
VRFGFGGGVRLWRRRLYREPECISKHSRNGTITML